MTMSDDNENEQPLNLDIPDHLEYSEEHAWVDRSVDPAIIGINEYAADQLGELVFVDLPEPGARVEAGDEIVELESSKAVQPLISPVAGTVKYVNCVLVDDSSVGVLHQKRYGQVCDPKRGGRPVRGQRRSVRRRLAAEG